MHHESYERCREFVEKHLHGTYEFLKVADVGSRDVNGTYRPLFARHGWLYTGLDTEPGPNVDHVLPPGDEADWPLAGRFDVVVSGQCVEHVPKPWKWIKQVASLARPGGLVWVCGPSGWVFHEHPIDCWRVWPDGLRALFDEAGLKVVELGHRYSDTFGLARKPEET